MRMFFSSDVKLESIRENMKGGRKVSGLAVVFIKQLDRRRGLLRGGVP